MPAWLSSLHVRACDWRQALASAPPPASQRDALSAISGGGGGGGGGESSLGGGGGAVASHSALLVLSAVLGAVRRLVAAVPRDRMPPRLAAVAAESALGLYKGVQQEGKRDAGDVAAGVREEQELQGSWSRWGKAAAAEEQAAADEEEAKRQLEVLERVLVQQQVVQAPHPGMLTQQAPHPGMLTQQAPHPGMLTQPRRTGPQTLQGDAGCERLADMSGELAPTPQGAASPRGAASSVERPLMVAVPEDDEADGSSPPAEAAGGHSSLTSPCRLLLCGAKRTEAGGGGVGSEAAAPSSCEGVDVCAAVLLRLMDGAQVGCRVGRVERGFSGE